MKKTYEECWNDINEVIKQLREIYSDEEVKKWLLTPHPCLENKMAFDLIFNGDGDKVLAVIARMNDGVYI